MKERNRGSEREKQKIFVWIWITDHSSNSTPINKLRLVLKIQNKNASYWKLNFTSPRPNSAMCNFSSCSVSLSCPQFCTQRVKICFGAIYLTLKIKRLKLYIPSMLKLILRYEFREQRLKDWLGWDYNGFLFFDIKNHSLHIMTKPGSHLESDRPRCNSAWRYQ